MEKEILKKIDKIAKKYHREMQRNMQRFVNEIMELKFEIEEDE